MPIYPYRNCSKLYENIDAWLQGTSVDASARLTVLLAIMGTMLADWTARVQGALTDWISAKLTLVAVMAVGAWVYWRRRRVSLQADTTDLAMCRRCRLRIAVRDVAIDAMCTFRELRRALHIRLAYAATVWCDPFNVSSMPIPLCAARQYWRTGPTDFRVIASDTKERRFTAWLYRWHDAPTADDWGKWSRWANLFKSSTPSHTLDLFRDGTQLGHRVEVELTHPALWYREPTRRSVKFVLAPMWGFDGAGVAQQEAPQEASPTYTDEISLGGLAPEQLIKDSKPPSSHSLFYAPPTRRPRRL